MKVVVGSIAGSLALLVAVLIFCVVRLDSSLEEERLAWEKYKIEHNCKPVEYKEGSVSVGVGAGAKGSMMIVTPTSPQICYECDDGKRYWRDE